VERAELLWSAPGGT